MPLIWPLHFPSNCPPDDASDCQSEVYRCTKEPNVAKSDFLSYRELDRHRPSGTSECTWCGLSVFKSIEDVYKMWARVPAMSSKCIAKGTLDSTMGKLDTPTSDGTGHRTWWKDLNCEPWNFFEFIEDNSET